MKILHEDLNLLVSFPALFNDDLLNKKNIKKKQKLHKCFLDFFPFKIFFEKTARLYHQEKIICEKVLTSFSP